MPATSSWSALSGRPPARVTGVADGTGSPWWNLTGSAMTTAYEATLSVVPV